MKRKAINAPEYASVDPFRFLRALRNTFSGRYVHRGMRLGKPTQIKRYGDPATTGRQETATQRRRRKRIQQRHQAAALAYNAAKAREMRQATHGR